MRRAIEEEKRKRKAEQAKPKPSDTKTEDTGKAKPTSEHSHKSGYDCFVCGEHYDTVKGVRDCYKSHPKSERIAAARKRKQGKGGPTDEEMDVLQHVDSAPHKEAETLSILKGMRPMSE